MNEIRRAPTSELVDDTESGRKPNKLGVLKKRSGISGFDEVTYGGFPEGRLTAVVGGAGTGKSLLALQNILNRATSANEPGLFVTFEESIDRVRSNITGFDWDLAPIAEGKVVLIDARLPPDVAQAGAFDFAGLLAVLTARKTELGALNVVFDGVDLLLSNLNDDYLERQELVRLDEWIRSEGVSGVITVKSYGANERDQRRLDLIQYITDTVLLLEARTYDTALARTLRVVKYRGSGFVANAVPMIIGPSGIEIVPTQGARESYPVFSERISSGVARLDAILDGGYIRGSSVLITGAPGTAKTSLACCLTSAACEAGRKAVFVSFDESDVQIIANMKSIGMDLAQHVHSGRLVMASLRSKGHSPEECFLKIWGLISRHAPDILVVDPLSAFIGTPYPFATAIGETLIDFAKSKGITFLSTSLLGQATGETETAVSHVSTIADTWIHVSYVVQKGERNRALTIIKSRGTGHSNQVRELILARDGLDLADVYIGEGGVLLGSARAEKLEEEARDERISGITHRQRQVERARSISILKAQAQTVTEELEAKVHEAELDEAAERVRTESRKSAMAQRMLLRRATDDAPTEAGRTKAPTGDKL
jgi:circadian clock protein KaiC